ncbi:MAG TPA: 3'-5' exonuclease [Micrococcaceae bacterium]|jgi:DNA polymerase-3 subunit epsilon
MNSWTNLPRAAFDLETTGRYPLEARLVTASIVVVDAAGEVSASHEWLADPGVEIPAEVTAIHGISTAHARDHGLPVRDVVAAVVRTLESLFRQGIPVMAFNATYDFTVLAAESARHGVPGLRAHPVLDPYVLSKQVDKYRRGKRTLVALCESYGVPLHDAHTSAADALATIRLADALAARHPQLRCGAEVLHTSQIGWAAAQAEDFQSYLRRKDPTAVVAGHWPVHQG